MKKSRILFFLFAITLLSGCATLTQYRSMDAYVLSADYAGAEGVMESQKQQYTGANEILYYFDKGALLQYQGRYKESSRFLHEAELKIEDLYTKSVSAEASSFFSNDLSLPYEGEDFEQVMVNVIKALNFLYMGDLEGAQVEARKVNNRMNVLTDKYEGKNIYKDDAFARYLSAFAYDAAGDLNDAYIDYKKSEAGYEQYAYIYGTGVPDMVKMDVLRIADAQHYSDDVKKYQSAWNGIPYPKNSFFKKSGEVLLVIYDGLAPYKIGEKAIPRFIDRGNMVSSAEVTADNNRTYESFLAEDLSTMAIKNLDSKMALIQAKAIARAVVKTVAVNVVKDQLKDRMGGWGFLADIAGNAYMNASEQADIRSWRTLPARFHLLRFPADGTQDVTVKLYMTDGTVRQKIVKVSVKPGKKKVIPVYCFK